MQTEKGLGTQRATERAELLLSLRMPRVCLRESRAPILLVRVKGELQELLSSSRVLLLDCGRAFFRHFGWGFWYTRDGLYSGSEVVSSPSVAAEVGQMGAGPLLTVGSFWQVRLSRRSWHKVRWCLL